MARLFGEYVGICFQIKDDIFDYYDSLEIGKPTGNDMREGKLTLPAIYALNSTQDADAFRLAIKVKSGEVTGDEIARLIEYTKQRRYRLCKKHYDGVQRPCKRFDCRY